MVRPSSRGAPKSASRSAVAALTLRLGSRLRALVSRCSPVPTSDALGRRGERVAARALRREGYRVLARRLRTRGGEIDLVVTDGASLVLVEVKTTRERDGEDAPRSDRAAFHDPGAFRDPRDRVDHAKRRRLSSALRALLGSRGAGRPHRFDVVTVVFRGRRATARHLVGAFRAGRDARRDA